MDYFHTDDPRMVNWLANVFWQASMNDRKVRIRTKGTTLQIKIGEGGWTAPFESTPDPYRDNSNPTNYVVCAAHTDIHTFNDECVGARHVTLTNP